MFSMGGLPKFALTHPYPSLPTLIRSMFLASLRPLGPEKGPLGLEKGSLGLEKGPLALEKGSLGFEKGPLGFEKGPLGLEKGSLGSKKDNWGSKRDHWASNFVDVDAWSMTIMPGASTFMDSAKS